MCDHQLVYCTRHSDARITTLDTAQAESDSMTLPSLPFMSNEEKKEGVVGDEADQSPEVHSGAKRDSRTGYPPAF